MSGGTSRRGHRRSARSVPTQVSLWRGLRRVRTAGIGLFLAGMIVAFALVLAAQSNSPTAQTAGPRPGIAQGGNGPQWVTLTSTSPAAIQSAARATRDFQDVYNSPQTLLGQALRNGTLGAPVLVHAYRPSPDMTDVWVIPVLEANAPGAHIVALLDFAYDAAHQRIRPLTFAGPFVPTDPEYGQPFPRLAPAQATALLTRARGLVLAAGAQPELVYFPANLDAIAGPQPTIKWNGGGQFPDLAIWRLPAANGHDYLAGIDSQVYTATQLPLAPNAGA